MARDLFKKFSRRARQFEATRGRPIAPSVTREFLGAELEVEAERASIESVREESIRRSREESELRREEIEVGRRAATIGGIADIGTTAAVLSDTKLGTFAGGAAKRVGERLGIISPTAPAVGGGAVLPAYAGGTPIATPYTDLVTGATGEVAPSVLGTAGRAVGKAAIPSLVGGFAGSKISEAIGGEGKGARNTGRVLGSTAAGFAFGGPLGGAVGGVIGLAQSETVICTELHRQGYIPDHVFKLDDHRLHDIDEATYNGYMSWAPWVVGKMQKSWLVTQLVRPFAVGWAYHMAHQLDKSISDSFIGKVLFKLGVPICRSIGGKGWVFLKM